MTDFINININSNKIALKAIAYDLKRLGNRDWNVIEAAIVKLLKAIHKVKKVKIGTFNKYMPLVIRLNNTFSSRTISALTRDEQKLNDDDFNRIKQEITKILFNVKKIREVRQLEIAKGGG